MYKFNSTLAIVKTVWVSASANPKKRSTLYTERRSGEVRGQSGKEMQDSVKWFKYKQPGFYKEK